MDEEAVQILDLLTSILQLAAAGAGLYAGAVLALRARRNRNDRPSPLQDRHASARHTRESPEHRADNP